MNEIKNNILEKQLKYKDTVVLKYKIEYPEIISSEYEKGKEVFNSYNKNKALELKMHSENELFKEAKELYDYNVANGYPVMVYEVILNYKITYNSNKIISLYFDEYTFTGGAHGSTIRTSQNWNLLLAKQIPLIHFFPSNPYYIIDIIQEINKQIQEQIDSGTNQFFDNYCQLVLQTFRLENYYISNKSLIIFFQQYDIAPYSSGIPTFKLDIN